MASTLTNLIIHVVFSTKYRVPMITAALQPELYAYMGGIIKNDGGIPLAVGGIQNHVHIVMKLKPSQALADAMRKIKGSSSKWINERGVLTKRFSWQQGYGAFSVSRSQVQRTVQYVRNQKNHHCRQTYKDEYLSLLEKHHIEYDNRYLWG